MSDSVMSDREPYSCQLSSIKSEDLIPKPHYASEASLIINLRPPAALKKDADNTLSLQMAALLQNR